MYLPNLENLYNSRDEPEMKNDVNLQFCVVWHKMKGRGQKKYFYFGIILVLNEKFFFKIKCHNKDISLYTRMHCSVFQVAFWIELEMLYYSVHIQKQQQLWPTSNNIFLVIRCDKSTLGSPY